MSHAFRKSQQGGCKSMKRRFRSKKEAIAYLRWLQNKSRSEVIPKRAYLCDWCKGYHLTSQEFWGETKDATEQASEVQQAGM